jgi:hypothetical protein
MRLGRHAGPPTCVNRTAARRRTDGMRSSIFAVAAAIALVGAAAPAPRGAWHDRTLANA